MIDITALQIECHADGGAKVSAWAKCTDTDDVDDLVAWLGLARHVLVEWKAVRAGRVIAAANVTPIKKGKE